MKSLKKHIIYFAAAALTSAGLTSCSDFLKEYSQDLAKVEGWQDLDEVLLGDGYMHSSRIYIANSTIYGSEEGDLNILHYMTDEIDLYEDNYCDYLGVLDAMFPFYTWQQDTGMDKELKYAGGDAQYWNDLYSRINVCNMVIALIDEQPEYSIDDAVQKERVKGEAYFLRGMCYFFLANLYAQPYSPATAASTPGIPLKTTEFIEDMEYDRGTLDTTYAQILGDLEEAAALLEDKTAKSKYHANREAALLMLSRVHLYMQDWDKAADYADRVLTVNSRLLNLATVADRANSVSISSPETLFSMGHYLIAVNFTSSRSGRDMPAFRVSDYMLGLYSRDDYRNGLYVGDADGGRYDGAFLKFNLQYNNWGGMNDVSSYCLLRTPEAYLNKAEALAYKGQDAQACKVLDSFLSTRMANPSPVTLSGNALIDFIREERAREFLLEGHRWFDLRRYTVCAEYPWSKTIDHGYHYYANYSLDYTDVYRLEEYDDAYTLPIPRAIREFQVSLGNNPRPDRQANRVDSGDDDDDWDDDWDW